MAKGTWWGSCPSNLMGSLSSSFKQSVKYLSQQLSGSTECFCWCMYLILDTPTALPCFSCLMASLVGKSISQLSVFGRTFWWIHCGCCAEFSSSKFSALFCSWLPVPSNTLLFQLSDVVLLNCGHPYFENFDSTISVDVVSQRWSLMWMNFHLS